MILKMQKFSSQEGAIYFKASGGGGAHALDSRQGLAPLDAMPL